jgi:hypothetical protein
VRADGAFVPFADNFDLHQITPEMKGIGKLGPVFKIDLDLPVASIVGRKVHKVGRTTGLTTGIIMACSVEYDDDKGITIYTDLLVLGDGNTPFDAEGDSGSLIVMQVRVAFFAFIGKTRERPVRKEKKGKEKDNRAKGR